MKIWSKVNLNLQRDTLALATHSKPPAILLVFKKEHSFLCVCVSNHISEEGYLLGFHGI